MINFYGLHTHLYVYYTLFYDTMWCTEEKERSSYFIFSVCPLLIIFSGLCSSFARHLLMAKESIWLCASNYSFVCPSPYDHIVRAHSVLAIYFFIMMIDRSIKSSEVLLFAHHHSNIISKHTHAHTMASFFFFFHTCRIVYHWTQWNGFTMQFSRKNHILQNLKLLNLFIYRSTNRFGSIWIGLRHFWNGDFILIARTSKNQSKILRNFVLRDAH